MSVVWIKCSRTGRAVPTGIETISESFARLPDLIEDAECPVCKSKHDWHKRDAWLTAVVPDFA